MIFIQETEKMNINTESALSASSHAERALLDKISALDAALVDHFSNVFVADRRLTRKTVSFQSNKNRRYYRLYKYKEAFSSELIEYLFDKYHVLRGKILDPFSGAGTALFACSQMGYDADGIELLPLGQKITEAGTIVRNGKKDTAEKIKEHLSRADWNKPGKTEDFEVLRITKGAYPEQAEYKIKRFLYNLRNEEEEVKQILLFALLCSLESVSYTRKDGQFLRWDRRSGRGAPDNRFDKGIVLPFDAAVVEKLKEIIEDMTAEEDNLNLFSFIKQNIKSGKVNLLKGSCLKRLPELKDNSYTGIVTSPPYCNRYDYTRTYALELAVLGVREKELRVLRQSLLSSTVENKIKDLPALNDKWKKAVEVCDKEPLLQEILKYLEFKKAKKELNNNGIVGMIRGYFYETACVIQECHRVLKEGCYMFVVNDNVKYAGIPVSVDIICSKIAESLGFRAENILILPQGKGNSSQQMGKYGRSELRKCVYVWKKPQTAAPLK